MKTTLIEALRAEVRKNPKITREALKQKARAIRGADFNDATFRTTYRELRMAGPGSPQPATFTGKLDADLALAKSQQASATQRALEKAYQKLLERKAVEDSILEVFKTTHQNWEPKISVMPPLKTKKDASVEEAVLLLSDIHIGQEVLAQRTGGYGLYNPGMYLARLKLIEDKVRDLLTNHVTTNIRRLHIIFLGDIVHGNLKHAAEVNINSPVAIQHYLAIQTLAQFIIRLNGLVPVSCYGAAVGNHGRWPDQKKMPTGDRFSNFDWLVYSSIKHALEVSGSGISFRLEENPFMLVDIQNHRFHCSHGDHLKGGDKQFGVPIHTMARQVMSVSQRSLQMNEKAVNYYLVGDKHKHIQLPLASGAFIMNGAFPGTDDYSLSGYYTPIRPMQLLFGVHAKYGKSWTYELLLHHAKTSAKIPYDLPPMLRRYVQK